MGEFFPYGFGWDFSFPPEIPTRLKLSPEVDGAAVRKTQDDLRRPGGMMFFSMGDFSLKFKA